MSKLERSNTNFTDISSLVLNRGIKPLTKYSQNTQEMPVLTIQSQSPRTEQQKKIREEAEAFMGIRWYGDISSGLTLPSAAHTLSTSPRHKLNRIITETIGREPNVPFESQEVADHLIVWMWDEKNDRMDMTRLSHLPTEDRERYLSAISTQTEVAVSIIQQLNSLTNFDASKTLRMYGVWGHGTPEERVATGLCPGAQSQKDFHFNIAHLPNEDLSDLTTLTEVSSEDFLKQIGVWDTVAFQLFNSNIQQRLTLLVKDRLPEKRTRITAEQVHGTNTDLSAVRFHDGYRIKFSGGVPWTDAMHVLLDIVKDTDELYEGLKGRYMSFQKNSGDKNVLAVLKDEAMAFMKSRGFDEDAGENLISLLQQIKPTYTQVESLLAEHIKEGSSPDDPSFIRLKKMKKTYQYLQEKFNTPNGRETMTAFYQNHYGISELQAKLFTKMVEETIQPVTYSEEKATGNISLEKAAKFTMPVHMSGSFLIEDYDIHEDRSITVNSMTIATRLGSTKGVIEDLLGAVLDRNRPQ